MIKSFLFMTLYTCDATKLLTAQIDATLHNMTKLSLVIGLDNNKQQGIDWTQPTVKSSLPPYWLLLNKTGFQSQHYLLSCDVASICAVKTLVAGWAW